MPSAEILASGIPVSDTVTSHSFQPYLSQEHAGGSQYRHPASVISLPLAAYIRQCSSSQEPAGDSQHQHPVSVELAPNLASHDDSNPHLQEHVGGSYPSPQLEYSTENGSYQAGRYLHCSSSNTDQHAPALSQPSSSRTPVEPLQSQSSLDVHSPHDQGHQSSNPDKGKFFDRLGLSRHVNRRIHPYSPKTSLPSVPPRSSRPIISASLIDNVKEDSSRRVKTYLFNQTLFPSAEKVEELAKLALNDAIAVYDSGTLFVYIRSMAHR